MTSMYEKICAYQRFALRWMVELPIGDEVETNLNKYRRGHKKLFETGQKFLILCRTLITGGMRVLS